MSNKWTGTAGPIQTKKVNEALSKLRWEANTYTELRGVIGGEERSSTLTELCADPRPDYAATVQEVGDRFNWTVTRENYLAVIEAVHAATEKLKATRPVRDQRETKEKHEEGERFMRERDAEQAQRTKAAAEALAVVMAKRPAWAMALIVAEHDVDDSDPMSDYSNHQTDRHVAIGWRSGSREDFKQLRAAASTFPETAHLGPDRNDFSVTCLNRSTQRYGNSPLDRTHYSTRAEAEAAIAATPAPEGCEYEIREETVEHRENYSMGDGNYVKCGSKNNTGWRVSSMSLPIRAGYCYLFEDHLPALTEGETQAAAESSAGGATIRENEERNGVEIHFAAKPAPEVIASLKRGGFRWAMGSRCWYKKRGPGTRDEAERIIGTFKAPLEEAAKQ
jgi:hypothetical protein